MEEDYGNTFTDEGRTYVTRIKAAVTRMTGLIDSLLTLARVRAKGEPFVPIQLGEVAQEVVADLTHRLAESGGTVDIGPLPAVEGDRLQMRQLLQNLIGNAIKFRRPGIAPRVRVAPVRRRAPTPTDVMWELRVADNGIGLEPVHAEKIFKPFERLHGHGSYEGSGLGLAVCARIVERHGGRIRAEGRARHRDDAGRHAPGSPSPPGGGVTASDRTRRESARRLPEEPPSPGLVLAELALVGHRLAFDDQHVEAQRSKPSAWSSTLCAPSSRRSFWKLPSKSSTVPANVPSTITFASRGLTLMRKAPWP